MSARFLIAGKKKTMFFLYAAQAMMKGYVSLQTLLTQVTKKLLSRCQIDSAAVGTNSVIAAARQHLQQQFT